MSRIRAAENGREMESEPVSFEEGTGNVFADLGFPNPDEHLQKAMLLQRLDGLLRERGLTQMQAAEVLGIDQPGLSRLLRGVVRGVSVEKLMQLLARLDQHVFIVVTPRERASDVLEVDVAAGRADDPSLVIRVEPSARGDPDSERTARAGNPRLAARSPRTRVRSLAAGASGHTDTSKRAGEKAAGTRSRS